LLARRRPPLPEQNAGSRPHATPDQHRLPEATQRVGQIFVTGTEGARSALAVDIAFARRARSANRPLSAQYDNAVRRTRRFCTRPVSLFEITMRVFLRPRDPTRSKAAARERARACAAMGDGSPQVLHRIRAVDRIASREEEIACGIGELSYLLEHQTRPSRLGRKLPASDNRASP
jgi:hypothetical protein